MHGVTMVQLSKQTLEGGGGYVNFIFNKNCTRYKPDKLPSTTCVESTLVHNNNNLYKTFKYVWVHGK